MVTCHGIGLSAFRRGFAGLGTITLPASLAKAARG